MIPNAEDRHVRSSPTRHVRSYADTGNTRLGPELEELAGLAAAHGREALVAALERAITFGRWKASRVRSILAAGTGVAQPTAPVAVSTRLGPAVTA